MCHPPPCLDFLTRSNPFTQPSETNSSVKCPSLIWRVNETQTLGGFWGAGSVPCLAQHQLRQAVLTHFICQHGGRLLPCNQKHGRDSLPCQLSPESNSAFSSGVGGSTNQRPWLLMTPGPSRDLRFISKAPVHEAISLWQFIFVLLEQWLHPAPAKPVQPGWMEMGR